MSSLSVTALPHRSLKEGLTLNGYSIPRQATILANVYSIHYDPNYFPEPYSFRLDHFLTESNKLINGDKLMTFSIGVYL